jgi:fructuronate reductase
MNRLSTSAVAQLASNVRRPGYDRASLAIGMAHIGVGAFHRCHQAEYADDMLEANFGAWGILGVNLKPPSLTKLLAPQDGLYTRTLREGDRSETRLIGAMRRVIDIEDASSASKAIAALAAPEIEVITMTLTEKGYCHAPATGALDESNAEVKADRAGAFPPATALGLLSLALERRRAAGGKGVTLISCDNVPSNGALLRSVLTRFIATRSQALAGWIETEVAFPSTMVDRIVPATSPEDVERIARALGVRDEAPVVGERFRQWVIEDQFRSERPPWDRAGAEFVADVRPYELIKMRILNAAQSTLSHLGALCGLEYSYQAAADPSLAATTRRMLERETAPTLPDAPGMEVVSYIETAMRRIENAAIRHRCHQIGTDGSQKIVQRLVNPLRERLATGAAPGLLALGVAGWIAYCLAGSRPFGNRWEPDDPYAATIIAIGEKCGTDYVALASAALGVKPVFGIDLATPLVIDAIAGHLRGLLSRDPRAYLRERLANG